MFVKGHQDDQKAPHKLDSVALPNICADQLALPVLLSAEPSSNISFFPTRVCSLSVTGVPITDNISNLVFYHPMRDYINSSCEWSFHRWYWLAHLLCHLWLQSLSSYIFHQVDSPSSASWACCSSPSSLWQSILPCIWGVGRTLLWSSILPLTETSSHHQSLP